jgi:2-polyprenyl-3-methyl-5-hydroxy-6-metoxy-1,4-benzoquinol methylase
MAFQSDFVKWVQDSGYKCSKAIIKSWQYQHPALRNLSDAICRLIDTRSGAALDVGCGTGRTSIMLARKGLRVDAVDIEPKVIAIARQIAEKEGFQVNFSVEDFSKEIHYRPIDSESFLE